jgi:hypothetical protein
MLNKILFDETFYYERNPDVKKAKIDASEHYEHYGILEGREGCLDFEKITFDELKILYYHTIAEDPEINKYHQLVDTILPFYMKNDIVLHLPILEYYATKCNTVTEFGVRHGQSTIAFLSGLPKNGKLISYDIEETPFVKWLKKQNKSWEFQLKDSLKAIIEITDMIFFDTVHTYEQLIQELNIHASKAKKYLAFHDSQVSGIEKAINEFLEKKTCKIIYKTSACNGLIVLEKIKF